MINSLKIYAIYSISLNNIEIDYEELPKDLHEFIKDFIKFFKVNKYIWTNISPIDLISNFNNKKNDILLYAAQKNHLEILKYLYQNGANNNQALMSAAGNGHLKIVKYIIE